MASSILKDREYYKKSLEAFLRKSDEGVKDRELISKHLPSVVRKMIHRDENRAELNILSVGCGDGSMDRYIVNVIQDELRKHKTQKSTKIFTCAIDPSEESVSEYKAFLDKTGEQVASTVKQQTFQEYKQEQMQNEPQEKQFDIVHFIHSIYYADPSEALSFCFEKLLHENGTLLCIVEGCDRILNAVIGRSVPVKQVSNDPRFDSYAQEITQIAKKRGLKVDLHMQEYSLDVTEVLDESSVEGNLVLDFMTQVKGFRALTENVHEILSLIEELSSINEDGQRLLKRSDGIIFLSKN
ncbi:histamine N-methyltransferase [Nematostella vectensis]|uniref:histamine N-methyltransferase n=1 Tax=Nematostella vectensis TaxID=45351 RepID=UPI0020776F76|nr:histamine N-methyltransferase [Nematostella vectensis]